MERKPGAKYAQIERLTNGAQLQFVELKGFLTVYVSISIHAGGNDRYISGNHGVEAIPAGAAHFLEHLIFSGDDNGLVERLAQKGISANAMTTYEDTIFYATGVGEVDTQTRLLLEAVFNTAFSGEEVELERPIILAELDMVENDPSSKLQMTLFERLYETHPIRDDIGGSKEDVRQVSSEQLLAFHQTYYAGDRVIVTVAGDIAEKTRESIREMVTRLVPKSTHSSWPLIAADDSRPDGRIEVIQSAVDLPQFAIGVKIDPALWPVEPVERYLSRTRLMFWLNTVFGDMAETRDLLLESGVIDDSFHHNVWQGDDYGMLLLFGHSRKPEVAAQMIIETLDHALETPPSAAMFDLVRRSAYGKLLRRQDSVRGLGSLATGMARRGIDVFSLADLYAKMDVPQVDRLVQSLRSEANRATVILQPERSQ